MKTIVKCDSLYILYNTYRVYQTESSDFNVLLFHSHSPVTIETCTV